MTDTDPITVLRRAALRLFHAGVAAADPARAVAQALQADPLPPLAPGGRRLILAIGKAAIGMAQAAARALPGVPLLIVTNHENAGRDAPAGATVFGAGHPVPDENGARAAAVVEAALAGLGRGDQVLVLLSGGGSALLPAPVAGVSLADKAEVNRLLLASGADIGQINLVRQQLSRLKGGGLARAAAPAFVRALILSDVVGDDLRVIASGPTAAPLGTPGDARALLRALGLWDGVPLAVRQHLQTAAPPGSAVAAENRLIGSNALSLVAMAQAAPGARLVAAPLTGDVADAAQRILDHAQGAGIWLFGGETTVRVTGPGLGGRNQELALRVALLAQERGLAGPWVFLSGGSDGRDGSTEAAGGLVDGGSLARMRAAGCDPYAALAANDSHAALRASGDLLVTGATGTNVADLQVMIRG